ncbi:hypothetical protein AUR64_13890 [Haloprofundus marisrubri]|uniref:Bacterio-opsin activator n=1 Tax=Haloprofundus marisrubri TaxID=1514971 RepID=A0A0W1R727_9EURY|nr:helix-turn-helix domain-containing protein [Haloprofundus marisrubri]KTG08898.1 hypothetical protein AUR64_13890 [Haloprofundus marisrubri]
MSFVVTFAVPPHSFVLQEALADVPGATVEFDRQVPSNLPYPFVWVSNVEFEAFEDAADSDASVGDLVRLDGDGDADVALYGVRWTTKDPTVVDGLKAGRSALLSAEWSDDAWSLVVRFDSRDSLAAFRQYCNSHELDFELDSIAEDRQPKAAQYDLSTRQYDALSVAFEMGYFNIPRDTTLGEVADQFGISTHAASERLRRGQTNLIAKTLCAGQSDDESR